MKKVKKKYEWFVFEIKIYYKYLFKTNYLLKLNLNKL